MSARAPKRPGPGPSHPLASAAIEAEQPPHKKPRFDPRNPSTLAATDAHDDPDTDPVDELILDADVIGRAGPQTKRNAVQIDGYDSDSEEEGFDARDRERRQKVRASAAAAAATSKDEEDDDMFADLEERDAPDGDEDEELTREGKRRGKKDVKFLDVQDIEGQVMGSRSGGHVSGDLLLHGNGKSRQRGRSASASSSSGDDEDRDSPPPDLPDDLAQEVGAGGKKKHAPRLDAFNLREEEEEGKFDESGNYVRRAADPDANNDRWLEGLSRKDMRRAKTAADARAAAAREATARNDALLTSDLLDSLIGFLESGETVLEALQRLNRSKSGGESKFGVKKNQKRKSKKNADEEMDVDKEPAGSAADPAETARRAKVEAITAAADALYSRAQHDIYDTERERLMRQFQRETGEEWKPSKSTDDSPEGWFFRWIDARDGGASHGPYDASTIQAWQAANYFGEGVEFRKSTDAEGEWSRVLDVS